MVPVNAFKLPVALAAVHSMTVVLLLLIRCLLLLQLWDSVIGLCFVVRYLVSILVLQSSPWRRESWLPCFVFLPCVALSHDATGLTAVYDDGIS